MTPAQFDAIREKTLTIFAVTEANILEKSIEILNAFPRYYDQYIIAYKQYQDIISKRDKLYGELYKKYRYDNTHSARTKNEVEPFITSDETYYQLCLEVNNCEMIVKYMEGICDSIKKLSYNIRNIIDMRNLGMQQ